MAQTNAMVTTLKKQLKAHGKTYSDLTEVLDLSEASIKRLFAEQNFTLHRLELICNFIGLQFEDLVRLMASDNPKIEQLSLDQEKLIVEDPLLLILIVSVLNGYSFSELLAHYNIDELELVQKLAMMDRLSMIELLPGNRIKLLVAPNFQWQQGGPIQEYFQQNVEREFFKSRFDKSAEKLVVLNGMLSKSSNEELQAKIEKLAREFNELVQHDFKRPLNERSGVTMVMGLRSWHYEQYQKYVR